MQNKTPWMHGRYAHIRLPKRMLYEDAYQALSAEAVLLYGALMDRTSLSIKKGREQFNRPTGEVQIIFVQEEIMRVLRCQRDKARKTLQELADAGLITVHHGRNRGPNRITVIPMDWEGLGFCQTEYGETGEQGPVSIPYVDRDALAAEYEEALLTQLWEELEKICHAVQIFVDDRAVDTYQLSGTLTNEHMQYILQKMRKAAGPCTDHEIRKWLLEALRIHAPETKKDD